MTAHEAMTKFTELILQENIPQWIELFHEDAVFEYPYAPPGFPQRYVGKAALFERFKDFPKMFRFDEFTDVQMHQTLDPNLIVVEFLGRGEVLTTGKPYHQRYISVVQMQDGKISRYRDYWNPLVVLEAFAESE